MNMLKKIIGFVVLFIIIVFIKAMFRGHRLAEQHKVNQYGATEIVDNFYINAQLTKQQEDCTFVGWSFKQFALFRDAGMAEMDVYTLLTNEKNASTKRYIASSLRWIYKDRSNVTPDGIAAEIAAACVSNKMPIGLSQ